VIRVELPNVLCSQPTDHPSLLLEGSYDTVGDALSALATQSPNAIDKIVDEQGELRRHVNIFLNDENIRFLDGLRTTVPKNATIFVLAAVSGG
jgi:molybdopterin converting factor small subunit